MAIIRAAQPGYYPRINRANPLTRALRGRKVPIPAVIFLTQVTTMILIGLWHGVTWNFFVFDCFCV